MAQNLNAGLYFASGIFTIGKREDVYNLFKLLDRYFLQKNIPDYKIISDRLYKRYLNHEQVLKAIKIIKEIQKDANFAGVKTAEILLDKLYEALIMADEFMNSLLELNEDLGVAKLIIADIPYFIYDEKQPNIFYDNLSEDAEPFWMREQELVSR